MIWRIGGSSPVLGRSDVASAGNDIGKNGVSIMGYADEVRAYCSRHYIQPARAAGKKEISIRAGDVHKAMGYKSRMPLVCSAIGTALFSEQNGIRRVSVDGPLNSANTVFRFKLS
jgi:hypothetical protein